MTAWIAADCFEMLLNHGYELSTDQEDGVSFQVARAPDGQTFIARGDPMGALEGLMQSIVESRERESLSCQRFR